jgi:Protein of unknown function (DUF3443)
VSKLLTLGLMTITLLAAGCGGGGSSSNSGMPPPPPPAKGTIATAGPPNVESLIIDSGPAILTTPPNNTPAINTAFITVQVCVPNTNTCQTFDHIEIDTGSVGLRILADAADTSGAAFNLALPAATDSSSGKPLAECLHFADGDSWGSLNTADLALPISGEKSAQPFTVHLIGAASAGSPPADCTPSPPLREENTVLAFGANGILGVGPFVSDCNPVGPCTPGAAATYFSCTTSAPITCTNFTASEAQQVPNPVTLFSKDNNGVIIELPAVAAGGATGLGTSSNPAPVLVFGIGTENNNSLGGAASTKLLGDLASGYISATLDGKSYPQSYFDSGSNGNFYSSSIAICSGQNDVWYCPASTVSENATLEGADGTMAAAPFDVANANNLFVANPNFTIFPQLAGPGGCTAQICSLDLGLPFFFGRNVYTGIEAKDGSSPPYFAYISN